MRNYTYFALLPIGARFVCGNTTYRKRSPRTATNLDYGGWHYFRRGTLVHEIAP